MKKSIILILTLFLLLSFVESSEIYVLDFSKENPQRVTVNTKDFVSFDLKNGTHIVKIDEIVTDRVNIGVFPYKQSPPSYVSLDKERTAYIDVDLDHNNDVRINLVSIENNKAILQFELLGQEIVESTEEQQVNPEVEPINEKEKTSITGEIIKEPSSKKANLKTGLLILVGIVIIGLLIFYPIYKRRTK